MKQRTTLASIWWLLLLALVAVAPGCAGLDHSDPRVRLQAIAEEHEIRAHDIVFIKTRTIPKTANGKIQRHLCKAEYLSGQLREIGSS